VNVIQRVPGAQPQISSGIPSYNNNGLVIVDGVPQTQADLNSINPADIEHQHIEDAATPHLR
jgi:hypothetical protein